MKSDRVLDSINDSILHQLFISIIKIIEFFCKKRSNLEDKRKNGQLKDSGE